MGSGEEAADGNVATAEAVTEPDIEYEREEAGAFGEPGPGDAITDPDQVDRIQAGGRRYVVNGVYVYKWGERRYQLDTDGRTMRLVTVQQWVHDRVLELDLAPDSLRSQWAAARSRRELISRLREADIEPEQLPAEFGSPDVDLIDLLLNVAWGLPLVSREERRHRFLQEHREFFESFQPQARQVLEQMLQKFADHGPTQLTPETLEVPPFTEMGTVVELARRRGSDPGWGEEVPCPSKWAGQSV